MGMAGFRGFSAILGTAVILILGFLCTAVSPQNISQIQPPAANQTCADDGDCADTQECINLVCICQAGHSDLNSEGVCKLTRFNDACQRDSDCPRSIGSACVSGACACTPGWVARRKSKSRCRRTGYQDLCSADAECSLRNLYCKLSSGQRGRCACLQGYFGRGRGKSCRQYPVREIQCIEDANCTRVVPNSECSLAPDRTGTTSGGGGAEGKCECMDGYSTSRDNLRCLFWRLGDLCVSDAECQVSVPGSECREQTCRCRQDPATPAARYVQSGDGTRCQRRILRAGRCASDGECLALVDNSFCNHGNTTASSSDEAPQNLSPAKDLPSSSPSAPIEEGKRPECACRPGYRESPDTDTCVEISVGDSCTSDAECLETNPNSLCKKIGGVGSVCQCEYGYSTQSHSDTLSDSSDLSATPEVNSPPAGARKLTCERIKVERHFCSSTRDCLAVIKSSECRACSKWPGVHACQKVCGPDARDTTKCDETRVCVCVDGHKSAGGGEVCRPRVLLNSCKKDQDCRAIQGDAVCRTERCICNKGFRNVTERRCVKNELGDRCYGNEDCQENTHSVCSRDKSVCECKMGYLPSNHGGGSSLSCRRRQIGEACAVDTDCDPEREGLSACVGRKCVCGLGYMASPDRYNCTRLQLHAHCDRSVNCEAAVANSVCDPNGLFCACVDGYYPTSSGICRQFRIGSRCDPRNDECPYAVADSACAGETQQVCACLTGFLASGDGESCTLRRLGDPCKEMADCNTAVSHSGCNTTDMCECDTGYMTHENLTECIRRKLNDTCEKPGDCNSVIDNSLCLDGVCQCRTGFDPLGPENARCVRPPSRLRVERCYFDEQCGRLHPHSTCVRSRCECPDVTFVSRDQKSCVPLPSYVGDECTRDAHCTRRVSNSVCTAEDKCSCVRGYFATFDREDCRPEPTLLGDFCDKAINCSDYLRYTLCNDSSCVCQYGYRNVSDTACVERPRLPLYVPIPPDPPVPCEKGGCYAWTNSTCLANGDDRKLVCTCQHRTARRYGDTECDAVQTYELRLKLRLRASTYDYAPLQFQREEKENLTDRIALSGVKRLFERSALRKRYVSSEVIDLWDLRNTRAKSDGVLAVVLVHITADYLNAEKTQTIFKAIRKRLVRSKGEVGESRLRVLPPYADSVNVLDYNECQAQATDCSPNANCVNTLGSYMCVCKPAFVDQADTLEHAYRGKNCQPPVKDEDKCLNGCDTNIEIVIIVVALFLLTIMVFITYEIIQRKKTFNARALYAKFGTTKIRKLKKASMRRIKERKRKMKEESKKRREEHRTKKEEMKKVGAAKKAEKNEEKKRLAEEKKQKEQESAERKKAEKVQKKAAKKRKNKDGEMEEQGSSSVLDSATGTGIELEESCIDMPVAEAEAASSETRGATTSATPFRCDNTYPVASPDMGQDWNFHDTSESPV